MTIGIFRLKSNGNPVHIWHHAVPHLTPTRLSPASRRSKEKMYDAIKNQRSFAPAIFTRFFPSEGRPSPWQRGPPSPRPLLKAASIFLWEQKAIFAFES